MSFLITDSIFSIFRQEPEGDSLCYEFPGDLAESPTGERDGIPQTVRQG
jgi:hypothetical protein